MLTDGQKMHTHIINWIFKGLHNKGLDYTEIYVEIIVKTKQHVKKNQNKSSKYVKYQPIILTIQNLKNKYMINIKEDKSSKNI